MDRKQLETLIEKEAYMFMNMIKEGASDSVMLWAQRNKVDVDYSLLTKILDQYKLSLESEWMGKVDHLMKKLDAGLEEYTNQENPFPPSKKAKSKND
jgi:hypothetical protein